jgi:hypothetical protein
MILLSCKGSVFYCLFVIALYQSDLSVGKLLIVPTVGGSWEACAAVFAPLVITFNDSVTIFAFASISCSMDDGMMKVELSHHLFSLRLP